MDLFRYSTAEVVEGFANIGRVVVCLVGVLRAEGKGCQSELFEQHEDSGCAYVTWSIVLCTFFRASTRFSSSI